MAKLELVIFDCDGVLVDSEPIINRAHAETLYELGYAITAETLLERFCGVSDADMLATIERELGMPIPADYEVRVNALIDAYCQTGLTAMSGIHDALARREGGWKEHCRDAGADGAVYHGLRQGRCSKGGGTLEVFLPKAFKTYYKMSDPAAIEQRAAEEQCLRSHMR